MIYIARNIGAKSSEFGARLAKLMKNLRYIPILAAFALASCQATGTRLASTTVANDAALVPTAPIIVDPVNGNWEPTGDGKGLYTAIFKDKVFISKSPQDKVLAKGSYTIVDGGLIKLHFQGAATKTVVNADCRLSTPTIMSCIPTVGAPFGLQKTS